MKAFEFRSTLNPDGTLRVPDGVVGTIPQGEPLRVIVLIPENQAEQEWEQMAAIQFGQGYADSDAIYDQLSSR